MLLQEISMSKDHVMSDTRTTEKSWVQLQVMGHSGCDECWFFLADSSEVTYSLDLKTVQEILRNAAGSNTGMFHT